MRHFKRLVVVDVSAMNARHCSLTCTFWAPPGMCRTTKLEAVTDSKRRVFLRTEDCIREEALSGAVPGTIEAALKMAAEVGTEPPRIDEIRTA